MSPIPGVRRWFRVPLSRETLERDIDEEIAFHLEMRAAELEADGLTAEEARAVAHAEYGDIAESRAELAKLGRVRIRNARRADLRDVIGQNIRWALRMLVREPALSLAVIVALAAGVGVNAVMFSVTDRLLFRAPPGIADAEEVGRVFFHATLEPIGTIRQPVTTWPQYEHLRTLNVLADAGAFSSVHTASFGVGAAAKPVQVVLATGSLFSTLGTRASFGRFFTDAESRDGSAVAVVSTPFWQRELGGVALDGLRVRIGRREYDVVGVAEPGFTGVYLESVDVWLPLVTAAAELGGAGWDTGDMQWLQIVVRRAAVPQLAAEAALTQAAREVNWLLAADTTSGVTLESVVPGRGMQPAWSRTAGAGRVALWLSGVSLLVLLIACANVANLLLARASRRRREIGVRLALGVGRARLAAQLMTETLVLGVAAGAAALLFAGWSATVLRRLLLPDVEWSGRPVLDARMLAFGGAIIVAAVLLAGMAPALHAARASVVNALGAGMRGGVRRSRVRSALVVLQAALSVMLLVGAGAFVKSLHNLQRIDMGFEPRDLLAVRWPAGSLELTPAERLALHDESLERLRRMPEVEHVALVATAPMTSSISVSVRPGEADERADGAVYVNAVTPGYFDALRTRVLRGRGFTDADAEGAEPVIVVSEALAARLWPGADPLTHCLRWDGGGDACRRVVGVMQSPRGAGPDAAPGLAFVVPLAQAATLSSQRALLVRLRPGSAAIGRVREALQTLRPGLAHVSVRPYDDIIAPVLRPWQLGARLFTAFGVLALALATLGLYGVVAYDVARRQHEMSVRVALGAGRAAIARIVLGDAGRLLGLGVAAGVIGAVAFADRLQPLLFGVSADDPIVLAAAASVIALAGLIAAAVPARRATRVDPMRALREE
jgi:putative ABC transport system permease protein